MHPDPAAGNYSSRYSGIKPGRRVLASAMPHTSTMYAAALTNGISRLPICGTALPLLTRLQPCQFVKTCPKIRCSLLDVGLCSSGRQLWLWSGSTGWLAWQVLSGPSSGRVLRMVEGPRRSGPNWHPSQNGKT